MRRPYFYSLTLIALLIGAGALRAQSPTTGPEDPNWKTTRVGVIDMNRVFLGYWASQRLDGELRAKRAHYRQMDLQKRQNVSKIAADGRRVLMALNDDKTPQSEIHALEARRDLLEEDFKAALADAETYYAERMEELLEFHEQKRGELLEQIMAVVKPAAEQQKLDMLLDISGPTFNNLPMVSYYRDMPDITEQVLATLNKGHEDDVEPIPPTNASMLPMGDVGHIDSELAPEPAAGE